MAVTIDTSLAVSLIDSEAKTTMRLLNRLLSTVVTSYDQGVLILPSGAVDQEIANTGFKKVILLSSELITVKVGSSTATPITDATLFVLESADSNSLFVSNSSGSDSTIDFIFVS